MANPNCTRCKKPLSKPRLEKRKRKCYHCEVAVRREQRQRTHDRNIESEDFTAADYWHLYEMQGGTCAIYSCRAKGKSKHLIVEHDHACEMGHDPKRWCRACVRGLTCSMHNEWIGRTGDDPEVFDSLAGYLRNPPAREKLMARMIVGNAAETITTLHDEYKVPLFRARKMLDMARGVGPSPTQVPAGTIVVRYIRIPRTTKVLYEIIETAPRIDSKLALKRLMDEHDMPEAQAKKALNAAWQYGKRKIKDGTVVQYHGRNADDEYIFSIEDGDVQEAE
jgi:Recombination endonuclease VII